MDYASIAKQFGGTFTPSPPAAAEGAPTSAPIDYAAMATKYGGKFTPTEQPQSTYYDKVKQAESGGVATAKADTSSALGHYQFTEGTWKDMVKKYDMPYSLQDRTDPAKSLEVVKLFTEDNKKYLTNALGAAPTDAQLYTAHFLGATGAATFLKADPERLATEVANKRQVLRNKNIFYDSKTKKPRTVGQVQELLANKMSI